MFTHGAANPAIYIWVREAKKMLARNDQAKAVGDRIQICSRQPKNLLAIAGGAGDGPRWIKKPPIDAGCYKCNHCKVSCLILNETNKFRSTNTDKFTKSSKMCHVIVTG